MTHLERSQKPVKRPKRSKADFYLASFMTIGHKIISNIQVSLKSFHPHSNRSLEV